MRRKLRAAGHGPWPPACPACALRPSPGFPGDARGCTCTCWTSFVDLWGSPRCHGLSFHRLVPGAVQLLWGVFFDLDRTACKASLISLGSALKIESYLQDLQNEAGHDIFTPVGCKMISQPFSVLFPTIRGPTRNYC